VKHPDIHPERWDAAQRGAKPGSSADVASTKGSPAGPGDPAADPGRAADRADPGRAADRADPEVVDAYVEEIGRYFEEAGWPRMAGRLVGALVIAEPREQTAAQLAEHLQASRGSISTMSRLLIAARLAERVTKKGDRRDRLRLRADAWTGVIDNRTRQIGELRALGERGLALFPGPGPQSESLEELVDLSSFMEREWPALVERWRRDRAARKGSIA